MTVGEDGDEYVFQAIDWMEQDHMDESDQIEYIIKIFGRTKDGASISVNVTEYTPYFYVQFSNKSLQKNMCSSDHVVKRLESLILESLPKRIKDACKHSVVDAQRVENHRDMVGFRANTTNTFVRLKFTSLRVMNYVKNNVFRKPVEVQPDDKQRVYEPKTHAISCGGVMYSTQIVMFESNIGPMLRMIHYRNLQPSGWIRLKCAREDDEMFATNADINVSVSCKDVHPYETAAIAPFVVLSFDLECTSSHGDFPIAKKNYAKPAQELIDWFERKLKELNIPKFGENDPRQPSVRQEIASALRGCVGLENQNGEVDNTLSKVYLKKPSMVKPTAEKEVDMSYVDKLLDRIDEQCVAIFAILNKDLVEYDEEEDPLSALEMLTTRLNVTMLLKIKGDPIIQIGSAVHRYGETTCSRKFVVTLNDCDPIEGTKVVVCKTEKELITTWCRLMREIDPDIIIGYNILGFDFDYLYTRATEMNCVSELKRSGRLLDMESELRKKKLSSSALGDNEFRYMEWHGRVIIDLMKVVQRDHKLDSYKLDHVASVFVNGKVERAEENVLTLNNTRELNVGDYLLLEDRKIKIRSIDDKRVTLEESLDEYPKTWSLVKDDVSPSEIFACQKGSSADRARIAKYCVQDCVLCNLLLIKLEMLANNIGMSNVCFVPLTYIFMRGQGIKIFSLVAKQCKTDKMIMPVLTVDENMDDDGYEGAIVLDPKPDIYRDPVSVMDYASLYPSSMISENISHDSIVLDSEFDNLENYTYKTVEYDIYKGKGDAKRVVGKTRCRYVQPRNDQDRGVLPRILMKLLSQRKLTRKRMQYETVRTKDRRIAIGLVRETASGLEIQDAEGGPKQRFRSEDVESRTDTYDDFAKAMLDGLQLAYKITANSLYGQVGARTSPIYLKELAASTTATGRNLIMKAKQFMEENYDATTVYGDTDSVFIDFKIRDKYGLEGKEALQKSIDISIEASKAFKEKMLEYPHDLEYEKTFWPFIILSKKKYIGHLYEHDVNKYKVKAMGIVLKRRDNANILKIVYGGIIDILLRNEPIKEVLRFLKDSLAKLIEGRYPLEDLVITKTLRGSYKDSTRIAHKVLQQRMFARDPGSAPQVNDRIPYVYVQHDRNNRALLQGDKIEHPTYIRENNVAPDYEFYISNQLQNPISQLLSLRLEDIPGGRKRGVYYYQNETKKLRKDNKTEEQIHKRIMFLRETQTRELLFKPILTQLETKRLHPNQRFLTDMFRMESD